MDRRVGSWGCRCCWAYRTHRTRWIGRICYRLHTCVLGCCPCLPYWCSIRVWACRETSLGNAPRIACLTAQGLRLGACLTCWGVLDACVRGCDPFAPDALTACCAGFCFGLRDDTALVDWATLDLGLDFCLAGWDLVARTEQIGRAHV